MESESQLLGVRFIAPAKSLELIERAARDAGWTDIRHERAGSILAMAPEPYHFEQFAKLIEAVEALKISDHSLQLIGPDGQPVELGEPENDK